MEENGARKKGKKVQTIQYKNLNPFKEMEKHFKLYQNRETDYSCLYEPEEYRSVLGYDVAFLPFPKGAILVRRFNDPNKVLQIAAQSLNQYWQKPYRTNLDSRQDLYTEQKNEELMVQEVIPQKEEVVSGDYFFNEKVRWANVGYQYDWTERKYPSFKTRIPQLIEQLCERANTLYMELTGQKKDYHPQSAIINYYGEKDYMTGHLDDAQIDQDSPIYSFSLGLSCVFLMGRQTKDEKPLALKLQSGDLLIMGKQSRKCYHGVPRIISGTYEPSEDCHLQQKQGWRNKREQIECYLSHHRININVRQVYPIQE